MNKEEIEQIMNKEFQYFDSSREHIIQVQEELDILRKQKDEIEQKYNEKEKQLKTLLFFRRGC
jgi:uncharacterized protein involved in exopolysaccharide biosynthesis